MKPINYPKLSNIDFGIFRLGGPGLANCMFFAARAYINSIQNGGYLINPTWTKFSIGPYLRKEKDKRVYSCLFKSKGISGIRKIIFLILYKCNILRAIKVNTLEDYFLSLRPFQKEIRNYFESIINKKALSQIDSCDVSSYIAIHVRLGDYVPKLRIPIDWYVDVIQNIIKEKPNQQFLLFSDGKDEELTQLTSIANITRTSFGNAIADMVAISRCKMLIASDSTFSAWGAFLGNTPIVFNRRHFPPVYTDSSKEFVLGNKTELSEDIKLLL